jgi:hypothetical protein
MGGAEPADRSCWEGRTAIVSEHAEYLKKLEADELRMRAALQRIYLMSVRPVCPCGRPTGTGALRACAQVALEMSDEEAKALERAAGIRNMSFAESGKEGRPS